MELELNDEKLSALDYARFHRLCRPYDSETLQTHGILAESNDTFDFDLNNPSDEFITTTASVLIKERLVASKDAVLLLKSVHDLHQATLDEVQITDRWQWMLSLKQELPVLRTDNELDLLNFGSVVMPGFSNLKIPFDLVDQESDEGFEWPVKYLKYPAQCVGQLKVEKLVVSREVLIRLQDAVSDPYSLIDHEKITEDFLNYKPNIKLQPVTPPLLPLSPSLTPYIPSSPANRLEFLSDSGASAIAEARSLEQQIMGADALARMSSDSSDSMLLDTMYPPQFSPLLDGRTTKKSKRGVEDLKIEGPLTPPLFSDSPLKKFKSVSFSETLHHFIPKAPWVGAHDDEQEDGLNLDLDELFKDIEPFAREATRKIENETLSGADTTARVEVPDVDFTLPVTPWNEYSQRKGGKHRPGATELGAQMNFILRIKREDLKAANSWHGLSSLERNLQWCIFTTKISKINLNENLHGEADLDKVIAVMKAGDIATSSSQIWKPDGLRILDASSDEEEIEPANMEEVRDMETLVRKRRLEMEEEAPDRHRKRGTPQSLPQDLLGSHHWNNKMPGARTSANSHPATIIHQGSTSHIPTSQHKSTRVPKGTSSDLMFGGFSTTTALHKFMETRGKAVGLCSTNSATTHCSTEDVLLPTHQILPARSRELSEHPVPSSHEMTPQSTVRPLDRQVALPPLPRLPDLPKSLAPCSFIFSSTFLQRRSLMKLIEQLYQQAEVIYRDYERPHSPAKEADVLLSPSTGLLLTNLQQIKQRPLPGQLDRSLIKERVTALQLRYERLIVVVSEGLSQEMESQGSSRPDDLRDKEALAGFQSYADHLEGEVNVKYVPGGEQALARSVVIEMANYGLIHGSKDIGDIKPVPVETTWEVFLRRVGINPFAAQVIVASLKTSFEVQLSVSSSSPTFSECPRAVLVSGLPAFLMMGEEERVGFFQVLMGGSRILKRVSRLLDQEWVSAVHGFRM